jgi:hypothetical protein
MNGRKLLTSSGPKKAAAAVAASMKETTKDLAASTTTAAHKKGAAPSTTAASKSKEASPAARTIWIMASATMSPKMGAAAEATLVSWCRIQVRRQKIIVQFPYSVPES